MRSVSLALCTLALLLAGCANPLGGTDYPYKEALPDQHVDAGYRVFPASDPKERWVVIAKPYEYQGHVALCAAMLYHGDDATYEKYRSLFGDKNSFIEVGADAPGPPVRISTKFMRFFRATEAHPDNVTILQIFTPQRVAQLAIPCVDTDHTWIPQMTTAMMQIRLTRTTIQYHTTTYFVPRR